MIRPIKIIDEDILRQKSEELDLSNIELIKEIAGDLIDTLNSQRGLGLAAVQIGIPKKIFIINAKELDFGSNYRVFINPRVNFLDGLEVDEEGCLSIPGLYADVSRPSYLELEAVELKANGKLKDVKIKTEGFLTRVFLHEIDHLEGVLFIDYLDEETRRILLAKWRNEYNKHSL
ncbi:MAG: peptide deformylase [Candidatus Hydrothermia bacterium]